MRRGERFDWAEIKAKCEARAAELDKHPRELVRDDLKAVPGLCSAFDVTRETLIMRGAKRWSDARDEMWPPVTPQPVHPKGTRLKRVSSYVNADGTLEKQWIIRDAEKESREEVLRRAIEEIPAMVPVRETVTAEPPASASEDLMAVYPLGDPHVGMLAWHGDAEADFDLEIVESLMLRAAHYLAQQGGATKRAVLANLGDYFHTDTQENRTRRSGHQLDVDSRYAKMVRAGMRILIVMVEVLLSQHEEVEVVNAIGNHDDESSLWLSVALDAYFRNEPRVKVDLSPAKFHYVQHGECLIGITHGDRTKPTDLEGVMAHDCAHLWSETSFRCWYTGHIHHKTAHEFRNCTVESFRTLAARDAYAQGHGYRARRDAQKILLHRDGWEAARFTADHRMLRSTA